MRWFSYAGFAPDAGTDPRARLDEFVQSDATHFLVYDRQPEPPLPFRPTMDTREFAGALRARGSGEVVVYKKPGADSRYREWLDDAYDRGERMLVLVGPARGERMYPGPHLLDAMTQARDRGYQVGAVLRAEDPRALLRMREKRDAGASFFVTQIVYDVERVRPVFDAGSDIVLTVSPFGSHRVLQIIQDCGVSVPADVAEHVLSPAHIDGRLHASQDACERVVSELQDRIIGVNVESVSTGEAHVTAAHTLLTHFKSVLYE